MTRSVDKQQALLILRGGCATWDCGTRVRRIENVYGEGGVGMNFKAWPFLNLRSSGAENFTSWFAKHRDTTGGFIERGTAGRASLQFSMSIAGRPEVGPRTSIFITRGLRRSTPGGICCMKSFAETPDWRVIGASLGYLKAGERGAC